MQRKTPTETDSTRRDKRDTSYVSEDGVVGLSWEIDFKLEEEMETLKGEK